LSQWGDEDKGHTLKVHSRLLVVLLAVGALSIARLGAAAEATEPIRIEYHAEPGCPNADEFNDQVFRRTASARLATSAELARTFVVSIERRGNSLVGSLVVRQADGTTESRQVAGPECGEVAKVLALATALAIDPEASLAANPEPRQPPRNAEPPPPSKKEPDTRETPSEPAGSSSSEKNAWFLALGGVLEGGITPRIAYGGSAGIGWRAPGGAGPVSSAGVDVVYLTAPTHPVGTASTSFQLVYARPTICTFALHWYGESGVAPCLSGEIGAVKGRGADITYAFTRSRVWASVDPELKAHQALGDTWFVEGELGMVVPVTRYHYVFRDPTTHIYSVPPVAVIGTLRLGARLW
jgi:hypothetical protein